MQKCALFAIVAVLCAFLAGCTPTQEPEDVPSPPEAPKSEPVKGDSARKVVTDYGSGLTGSIDKTRKLKMKSEMDALNTAVQNYYLENGKYPASLDEISSYTLSGTDLSAYDYDPETGRISIR